MSEIIPMPASEKEPAVRGFEIGSHSIASPDHANEDGVAAVGYQIENAVGQKEKVLRAAVIDGSGDSVGGKDEAEALANRKKFLGALIEKITKLISDKTSYEKTVGSGADFTDLKSVVDDISRLAQEDLGCAAIVAIEAAADGVTLVSAGDSIALRWKEGGQYENEIYLNETGGGQTSFQALNRPENKALFQMAMGKIQIEELETHPLANELMNAIGVQGRTAYINTLHLSPADLDADFILLASDGANPLTLAASKITNENRRIYKESVEKIMHSLSEGEIDVNQAAQFICEAAQKIEGLLEKPDDITVVIVDVRGLRAKFMGEKVKEEVTLT